MAKEQTHDSYKRIHTRWRYSCGAADTAAPDDEGQAKAD